MTLPTKFWEWIKAREGGYVNDPDDPGGATKYGITTSVYRKWVGKPDADVRLLDESTASAIYADRYYKPYGSVEPLSKRLFLFDTAVNMGPSVAAALSQYDWATALDYRRGVYIYLCVRNSRLNKFLRGWFRRCQLLSSLCSSMDSDA